MTQEEIIGLMNERHYSLHFHTGDKTVFSFNKPLNNDMEVVPIFESTFYISCAVNTNGSFTLAYLTKRWNFQLSSSEMSPITRNDFEKIEKDFIRYARRLHNASFE